MRTIKIALTALGTFCIASGIAKNKQSSPNLILFLADDAGYSAFQPYTQY